MSIDYESLKLMARQVGRSVKDLIALSCGNDPFYVELTSPHWVVQFEC